jgi:hypothetical protein
MSPPPNGSCFEDVPVVVNDIPLPTSLARFIKEAGVCHRRQGVEVSRTVTLPWISKPRGSAIAS